MRKRSVVVVSLNAPREKVWGVLLRVDSSGITVRGIDINSFDDWSRAVARGDDSMGLSTVFFPMHRVERIHLDESVGGIGSFASLFESRVGQTVWQYLELPAPSEEEEPF